MTDIKKYIVLILFCFLLAGCRKYDNIRDPISVKKINWQYYTKEGKGDPAGIQIIEVSLEKKDFRIERLYFQQFSKLMLDNKDKIYTKPNENTIKIYFRFSEDNPYLTMLYYEVNKKYNGKESTFYLDKSLLSELEKLQQRMSK